MGDARTIKVLVIDDSALIRRVLSDVINSNPGMRVVGAAPDPIIAREMIKSLDPDVLTLDVEMPRMDGLEFLDRLMRLRPTPVVMVSSLTDRGSEVTLRALELGAVDYVAKPKLDIANGLREYGEELAEKIRTAATARVKARLPLARPSRPPLSMPALRGAGTTEKLLIIGASTGGTEAIRVLLEQLPPDAPGTLITQHMPENFTRSFANRLDSLCRITVKEAVDGDRVLPGHAYIAPGHSHLLLRRSGANYVTALSKADPVNRHRPSVDVLFHSAAESAGPNAIGIILTGMGKDGAAGMVEMKRAGAWTVAQDEASCVVFGMPREAIALGGVDEIVSLDAIPARVLARLAASGPRAIRV